MSTKDVKKELTIEERLIYGKCPVCNAEHGEKCDTDQDGHMRRMAQAPKYIYEETE